MDFIDHLLRSEVLFVRQSVNVVLVQAMIVDNDFTLLVSGFLTHII